MRPAVRLLAQAAKSGANYLTPGQPTGISGILTAAAPRQDLIILYHRTLDKLQQLPEVSVYRTATEALTKHRLAIVESQVPAGFEAWKARIDEQIRTYPGMFGPGGAAKVIKAGDLQYVLKQGPPDVDTREVEWDDEAQVSFAEGSGVEGDYKDRVMKHAARELRNEDPNQELVEFEDEPRLTTQQIEDIEERIGGGLIEEVIQVAEGELKLVDEMLKARVWEDLEEKPAEGQWTYFERDWFVMRTHSS